MVHNIISLCCISTPYRALVGGRRCKSTSILSINKGGYPATGSTIEPQKEQVAGITANLCAAGISLHIKDDTITPAENDCTNQLLEVYQNVFKALAYLRAVRSSSILIIWLHQLQCHTSLTSSIPSKDKRAPP